MLCDVINGSNIDNDMMQSLNGMNNSYIFSLLPHILVLSDKNITYYKVMTMCQLNLMFTLTYVKPSLKLNPHLKGHE